MQINVPLCLVVLLSSSCLCFSRVHSAAAGEPVGVGEPVGEDEPVRAKQTLTPEGQQRQRSHRYLFDEFLANHEPNFRDASRQRLDHVVMNVGAIQVDGDAELALPTGTERVLGLFRHLELRGQGLDTLDDLTLWPAGSARRMYRSTQSPDVYRVQLPSLPRGDVLPPLSIRTRGKATIHSVVLRSFGLGIPRSFDDAPYKNLGYDQPPVTVNATLSPNLILSQDGVEGFDRRKWFRFYGVPNTQPREIEQYAIDRHWIPGRQMFKFQPALVRGYSAKQPKLQENPNRSGWADPSFFQRYEASSYRDVAPEFDEVDYAMCFNDWPDFMSVPQTGRGTPRVEHFDAAADLAAAYVEDVFRDSGRGPSHWEVKNESTIKAEWDYHYQKNVDAWSLLAEFHRGVADAIRGRVPHAKVGGPASAWMQVQVKDFFLWREQARFMDETKGALDFYSHHFYEDAATLAACAKRSEGYTNYLLGRTDVILDMFAAHMDATDNVRPIAITEFGSLNVGISPSEYWLRLRSYNAFLVRFMQRPSQLDFVVPFFFLSSPWDPTNENAAFVPDDGTNEPADQLVGATHSAADEQLRTENAASAVRGYRMTPVGYTLDLWRDFDGRRIPIEAAHRYLESIALADGRTLRVAFSNMSGKRLSVNLSGIGATKVVSAKQRRLTFYDGEIRYDDGIKLAPDLTNIPIDGEETCIVTIQLEQPVVAEGAVEVASAYAPQTAVKSTEASDLEIVLKDHAGVGTAQLVVGVHRVGGLVAPLKVTMNGEVFEVDTDWTKGVSDFMEPIAIDLPIESLEGVNRISIEPQPGLTVTSVKLQTTRRR